MSDRCPLGWATCFLFSLHPFQDYFTHIETSQSVGGAKREYPGKTNWHTRKHNLACLTCGQCGARTYTSHSGEMFEWLRAPRGAVWSGCSLFAFPFATFWQNTLRFCLFVWILGKAKITAKFSGVQKFRNFTIYAIFVLSIKSGVQVGLNFVFQQNYSKLVTSTHLGQMSLVVKKPVFGVSDKVRQKPGCTATEYD